MPKTVNKNLHVPLPEPLYRRLRAEAERERRPATEIARQAIDHWLSEHHRLMVREAIKAYAVAAAGSTDDLDVQLEAAAADDLLDPSDPENAAP